MNRATLIFVAVLAVSLVGCKPAPHHHPATAVEVASLDGMTFYIHPSSVRFTEATASVNGELTVWGFTHTESKDTAFVATFTTKDMKLYYSGTGLPGDRIGPPTIAGPGTLASLIFIAATKEIK